MRIHNDWENWILQECEWIKCNLIITSASNPEPTIEEAIAIYNSPRIISVREFKDLYFKIRVLETEIDKLDVESRDPECTEANQALITTVKNNLTTQNDILKAERLTRMTDGVSEYWESITTDFSNAIIWGI